MDKVKLSSYTVHKPAKKINYYISYVRQNNKNIKITVNNTSFISIKRNSSDNEVLKLFINNIDIINKINLIDKDIFETVLKYNNIWFNNNLTDELISGYFRESFNSKNSVISLLISDVKLPIIYYNDNLIENLTDIKINNTHIINVEIECEGIFFYKDKFGLKWIVRILKIYDSDKYINDDEIVATKSEIENEWDYSIKEFETSVNQDCEILKNKLDLLEKFKKDLIKEYEDTKNITTADNFWNSSFTKISKQISKYYNGTLKL